MALPSCSFRIARLVRLPPLWTSAALNPIEMVSGPRWFLEAAGAKDNGKAD